MAFTERRPDSIHPSGISAAEAERIKGVIEAQHEKKKQELIADIQRLNDPLVLKIQKPLETMTHMELIELRQNIRHIMRNGAREF